MADTSRRAPWQRDDLLDNLDGDRWEGYDPRDDPASPDFVLDVDEPRIDCGAFDEETFRG